MTSYSGRLAAVAALLLVGCHKGEPTSTGAVDAAPPAPPPSAPVNATPLPSASVAKIVNPLGLPPYAGPTGSVEGIIRVEGPAAPDVQVESYGECPDGRATYGKLFREGAPEADGRRPLADAVVAITGYEGGYIPERNETASVTIEGCALGPRAVAMTFGQRLEVKNDTGQFWAPVLEQASTPALMITAPHAVDPVRLYPPKPGWYSLVDRMKHSYARTDVYVLLQPLHTVSDLAGHYRIDGVPVGKLKVGAHVAAIGDATAEVEVLAGVVKTADLVLRYAPKPPAPTTAPKTDAGRPPQIIR